MGAGMSKLSDFVGAKNDRPKHIEEFTTSRDYTVERNCYAEIWLYGGGASVDGSTGGSGGGVVAGHYMALKEGDIVSVICGAVGVAGGRPAGDSEIAINGSFLCRAKGGEGHAGGGKVEGDVPGLTGGTGGTTTTSAASVMLPWSRGGASGPYAEDGAFGGGGGYSQGSGGSKGGRGGGYRTSNGGGMIKFYW